MDISCWWRSGYGGCARSARVATISRHTTNMCASQLPSTHKPACTPRPPQQQHAASNSLPLACSLVQLKFKEVQYAYEILSDKQERAWYDSHRAEVLQAAAGAESDSLSAFTEVCLSASVLAWWRTCALGCYTSCCCPTTTTAANSTVRSVSYTHLTLPTIYSV